MAEPAPFDRPAAGAPITSLPLIRIEGDGKSPSLSSTLTCSSLSSLRQALQKEARLLQSPYGYVDRSLDPAATIGPPYHNLCSALEALFQRRYVGRHFLPCLATHYEWHQELADAAALEVDRDGQA